MKKMKMLVSGIWVALFCMTQITISSGSTDSSVQIKNENKHMEGTANFDLKTYASSDSLTTHEAHLSESNLRRMSDAHKLKNLNERVQGEADSVSTLTDSDSNPDLYCDADVYHANSIKGRSTPDSLRGSRAVKITSQEGLLLRKGKDWYEKNLPLIKSVGNSFGSLMNELKILSQNPKFPLDSLVYFVEGYIRCYEDAVAVYEDFLNGTSEDKIDDKTLIEKMKTLKEEISYSIKNIVLNVDENEFCKQNSIKKIIQKIKDLKMQITRISLISTQKGIDFEQKMKRECD
jgi:hypothetical protein